MSEIESIDRFAIEKGLGTTGKVYWAHYKWENKVGSG